MEIVALGYAEVIPGFGRSEWIDPALFRNTQLFGVVGRGDDEGSALVDVIVGVH